MLLTGISALFHKGTEKSVSPHPWRASLLWRNRNYTFQDLISLFPQLLWIHYLGRGEGRGREGKQPYLRNLLVPLISHQLLQAIFKTANITHSDQVICYYASYTGSLPNAWVWGTETHALHTLPLLLDHHRIHVQMRWSSAAANRALKTGSCWWLK